MRLLGVLRRSLFPVGGNNVSTVAPGDAVTLTAAVNGGTVTQGLVNFCNAAATYCTDIQLIGSAQLTSAGTATFTLLPGIGVHSYRAVFAGTNAVGASASSAASLTVTGSYPHGDEPDGTGRTGKLFADSYGGSKVVGGGEQCGVVSGYEQWKCFPGFERGGGQVRRR